MRAGSGRAGGFGFAISVGAEGSMDSMGGEAADAFRLEMGFASEAFGAEARALGNFFSLAAVVTARTTVRTLGFLGLAAIALLAGNKDRTVTGFFAATDDRMAGASAGSGGTVFGVSNSFFDALRFGIAGGGGGAGLEIISFCNDAGSFGAAFVGREGKAGVAARAGFSEVILLAGCRTRIVLTTFVAINCFAGFADALAGLVGLGAAAGLTGFTKVFAPDFFGNSFARDAALATFFFGDVFFGFIADVLGKNQVASVRRDYGRVLA